MLHLTALKALGGLRPIAGEAADEGRPGLLQAGFAYSLGADEEDHFPVGSQSRVIINGNRPEPTGGGDDPQGVLPGPGGRQGARQQSPHLPPEGVR
ncbi:hypothetical protein AAH978_14380 [Streptomyces sp. ZYX-F-203]